MTISIGDHLPEATLLRWGEKGPEAVSLHSLVAGRNVVLFGLPGAYTPTCTAAHVPSFIRTIAALKAKGVDAVICVSVNDAHVMRAWGETTGAAAAGIMMLADGASELTKALGMAFDAPAAGMFGRSQRYALQAVDGVVRVLHIEQSRGTCEGSGGEAMLAAI